MLKRAVVAFLALVVLAGAASAQWQEDYPVLRVGIVAGADPVASRNAAEPFRQYLEAELQTRVELFVSNDYAALISGQISGRYDLTFLTASAFVTASAACGCIDPLVSPTDLDGAAGFYAILVVGAESAIDGPEDLGGMRLAVSADDSLAGRAWPLALFAADGIDVSSIALVSSESPEAALRRLITDEADAALAWSNMEGARTSGYGRGVLRQMVDNGALDMSLVEIVWTSPLIPYGPLTILSSHPTEMKADVLAAMLELSSKDPAALSAVNGSLGGAFVAVDATAFEPLMILVDEGAAR